MFENRLWWWVALVLALLAMVGFVILQLLPNIEDPEPEVIDPQEVRVGDEVRLVRLVVPSPLPPGPQPLVVARQVPLLLLMGEQDPEARRLTMAEQTNTFRQRGHKVEFQLVPGLAHGWPRDCNEAIWAFLSQHRLPAAH